MEEAKSFVHSSSAPACSCSLPGCWLSCTSPEAVSWPCSSLRIGPRGLSPEDKGSAARNTQGLWLAGCLAATGASAIWWLCLTLVKEFAVCVCSCSKRVLVLHCSTCSTLCYPHIVVLGSGSVLLHRHHLIVPPVVAASCFRSAGTVLVCLGFSWEVHCNWEGFLIIFASYVLLT